MEFLILLLVIVVFVGMGFALVKKTNKRKEIKPMSGKVKQRPDEPSINVDDT